MDPLVYKEDPRLSPEGKHHHSKGNTVSMKLASAFLTGVFGLSSVAYGGLLGDSVNFATSATGTTTISAPSVASAVVVNPGAEALFCVGPNFDGCVTSGFHGTANLSDNAISFLFSGSNSGSTGGFTFVISGINLPVLSVTPTGGSLNLGTFGVSAFTASSITFAGTAAGGFDAFGGRTLTFAVTQAPEPTTLCLSGAGLALLAWQARRRFSRR